MINMKLIKLKEDHYVVVDDSEIKEGDWLLDTTDNTIWGCYKDMSISLFPECKKITHSTLERASEDYEKYGFKGLPKAISLQEVKESFCWLDGTEWEVEIVDGKLKLLSKQG